MVSLCIGITTAFVIPQTSISTPVHPLITSSNTLHPSPISSSVNAPTKMYLFQKLRQNQKDDQEDDDSNGAGAITMETNTVDVDVESEEDAPKESKRRSFRSRLPFFASRVKSSTTTATDSTDSTTTSVTTSTTTSTATSKTSKDDPVALAKELKRQAIKARLEAEKLDAQLTLKKIHVLEQKLSSASDKKEDSNTNDENIEDLLSQITVLKQKLTGEAPKDTTVTSTANTTAVATAPTETKKETIIATPSSTISTPEPTSKASTMTPLSTEELKSREEAFLKTPKFLRDITAKAAGFDLSTDSNITALIEKMYQDEQQYLFATSLPTNALEENVQLSPEKLQDMVDAFERLPSFLQILTAKTAGVYEEGNDINATKVVLSMEFMMENDPSFTSTSSENSESKDKLTADGNSLNSLFGSVEDIEKIQDDSTRTFIESLFPKSTRKEGEGPTSAQMDTFYSQVLDSKTFMASGKPEPLSGGYLIRGTNQKENGNQLMEILDAKLDKSSLQDRVSVFFVKDPTPVTDEQMEMAIPRDPVLFVTGPNVSKASTPILTTIASAFGIASISFLSLYPYLLNEDVAKRVDEQITLASSSTGGANLDFLNDLTAPIFFMYIGLQLAHEVAHFAVSKLYGFDIALFPAWVPSPILGLTSSITALRSSPKDKNELMDFALAGPITGMLLSIGAIYLGLQMTLDLDTAAFNALPCVPVGYLMQSSLGGGIVEGFLGPNTLTGVANPTETTIHVHPFVIAGYASLITNALNLTPYGRTDGGRVSLALFGRGGAQFVGILTLITLFTAGIFSSDSLLLYFAFILFYQNELEIPLRNEVDDVDFSKVLLATLSGVLVLLTIIPMY